MSKKKPKASSLTDDLKAAIQASGVSVYQLSKDCGVAQPVLSRFLSGQRDIYLATAEKLATHFGLRFTRDR